MTEKWTTKDHDMHIAQTIMEEYAHKKQVEVLGLFEVVVDQQQKKMDFRIANWVFALAEQFNHLYGAQQGDFVTRQVITSCMRQDQTLH